MPCSPARAASMAAFRASRFVWLAISEITWMISLICCELVRICSIDSIDFCTALPPCSASWLASVATLVASLALSLTALDRAGQFFDRGGHLLDAGALRLRAGGQRLRTLGDHPRAFGELVGALGDLLDRRADARRPPGSRCRAARRRRRDTRVSTACEKSLLGQALEHLADVVDRA